MEDRALFAEVAKSNPLIYTDPDIEQGMPCIAGTPIPVYVLLGHLRTAIRQGDSWVDNKERELSREQMVAALQFTIDVLLQPYQTDIVTNPWLQ